MLRITQQTINETSELYLLEGKLIGPWVDELQTVIENAGLPVKLDLSGLSFADAGGLQMLSDLMRRGVTLSNMTSFLASQLPKDLS